MDNYYAFVEIILYFNSILPPGFLLSAKYDGHDVKDAYESLNLSIPVGLSYEFKNGITIDWRGTLGLTTVNKHSTDDDKYRSDAGWLTVGYKFSL